MKAFLYILSLFVFIQNIYSQIDVSLNNFYQEYLNARRRDQSFFNHVNGTPYENPNFSEAFIYFRDNETPVKGVLRYNAMFDEMELKKDESDEYLILENKGNIDSIYLSLPNEIFKYAIYSEKDDFKRGYFLQLYKGSCSLFLKRVREYQPEKPAAGYQDYVPPSIIKKPDQFFVQFDKNPLMLVPQGTNKIVNLFKQNGYEIGDFVKKNKTKYNQDSLLELFHFCNP